MKNLIIVSLLTLMLLTPSLSYAQAVTQEEVNAQLLVLINDLMKQVQALMVKLVAMQTQQVTDSQTLQTVVSQTQPAQILGVITPVVTPVIDIKQQCEPLKKNLWELWDERDFATEFGLVYGQATTGDDFRRFQRGAEYGMIRLVCPATPETDYLSKGCQKFYSENPEWLSCMKGQ